jgi:hypothetical protein
MPKTRVLQSSLTTGVISPTLEGRVDIAKYYNALTIGENITLMPHGGAKRRAGTRPVLKDDDSAVGYEAQEFYFNNSHVRFESFVFNIDQKYLIVFTADRIYIVKDLLVIAQVNPIDFLGSAFSSAYSSAFGVSFLQFTETILREMDVAQYGDSMIMVHPDMMPLRLIRGATETTWTIEEITFKNIPLYDYDNNYLGRKEMFAGDGTSLDFVLIYTIPPFSVYLNGVKILSPADYSYDRDIGKITFVVAPANGDEIEVISGAGVSEMNADHSYEDLWSESRGYPKTVTIFQGRLYFGGTKSKPVTVLGSVINDYFDFNLGGGEADMGIFDTLASGTFDDITAITATRTLQCLTESGEYYNPAVPVTPSTSAWKRQTGYGAARTNTIAIDGATYFVDRNKSAIRQFVYSLEEDGYVSPNISLLSNHLIYDVQRMAVTKGKGDDISNLVYVLNGNGTMAVLNSMRLENIQGWSRWTTKGVYKEICAVDNDLYMLVGRGYDQFGEIKYYIEKVDEDALMDHYHAQGQNADIFLGDAITKTFDLVNSTNGNFTVFINDEIADPQPTYSAGDNSITFTQAPENDVEIYVQPDSAADEPMVLPTSAAMGYSQLSRRGDLYYEGTSEPYIDGDFLLLDFDEESTFMEAGFNFIVRLRTVNLNGQTQAGQIVNSRKRLVRVKLNVYETLGVKVENYRIADRQFVMDFDRPLNPYTGIKEVYLLGYADHNAIEITQEIPMPFTLLQIETEIKY